MGRQKFNKRDHIARANTLHESRDLTNKGFLMEQQSAATCYICSGNTVHQQVFYPPLYPWGNAVNQHISGVVAMTPNSNWPTAIANGWLGCGAEITHVNGTTPPSMTQLVGAMSQPMWSQPNDIFYWATADIPNIQCGITQGGTIDAYSCFGGQMVTFAFPSNNIQAVPHIGFGNNDIFVELGYSYWSSGIDQNEYGQPDSDIDPFINYGNTIGFNSGIPVTTNQIWFTDQSFAQAVCQSGNTNTATCMNVKTVQCNNPSSGGEWPCATIDGVVPDQTYVGKVLDAGASDPNGPIYFEITEITPSGSSPWGTQDFPEIQTGCPPVNNANSTTSCTIAWNTPCADTELNTGGESSWTTFLGLRQTGWDSVGCQHLQNVVNWNTNQLNSGVNASGVPLNNVQISRKTEQISWAQCQANECGCPSLNVPALTGGPTPPPPSTGGPTPPPNPLAGTGGIKPEKKKGEINKKDKKKLNEEFTKMRTLWRYNK